MQFVRGGPDIPERLLQLHEEGRIVFFCGAGISYPARLPGFGGLVDRIYQHLSVVPSAVQRAAIKSAQFDTAIGLLEADVVGGRDRVRRAMAEILSPNLTAPGATATHEALLALSQNRDGRTRLITTNFDRLFQHVIESKTVSPPIYQAPLLPVPKTRWDGLIYLHGLLAEAPTSAQLDRLVISSGDFGLAYLTERWAARFVSELFRGYTICFVGYSINDPVLRYMMDALAADRLLGETPPEMFAFGSYTGSKKAERSNEWRAKNVTAILYLERPKHDHTNLHKTLHAWAATYRDGVRGKERIVVESAISRPLARTKQDDYVGRMLWALADARGLPAKRFAELDPVPSLDWLEPLCENLYRHTDLGRFGVPPVGAVDPKLEFSLTFRPSPYTKSSWMTMADSGGRFSDWDEVMHQLARWLTRHVDEPRLLLWLVKRGGQLHEQLIWLIERHLEHIAKLEREGDAVEIARLRRNAPSCMPRPAMRVLWRLLLTGRIRSRARDLDAHRWREHFLRDGMTASLRLALRDALTPCISVREPFRWGGETTEDAAASNVKSLVEWEIELGCKDAHSTLRDLSANEQWNQALPRLLEDFVALLKDALDLMAELGGIDSRSDRTYLHLPSISDHPQNRDSEDWTYLIELTRDAWLATLHRSPAQARIVTEVWAHYPYPVFRRLALYAAAQGVVVPTRAALELLLSDECWWLWSVETQRESSRLVVALATRLDAAGIEQLEQSILAGPPRAMFREDVQADAWARLVDRNIWLRLAKLGQAGAILSANGRMRLETLSAQHPEWKLAEDHRDEFPVWMEGGWVGDRDPWKSFAKLPRTRRGLLDYVLAHPDRGVSDEDDWRQRCSESFQAIGYALCKLAHQGVWPVVRWRDALQAWSEENLRDRSWHYMAPVLIEAPNHVLSALAHGVGWWLQSIAKSFRSHENLFLRLIERILDVADESEVHDDDPVLRAINHPIGHVTQALLDWWHRRELEDGQLLPENLQPIFSRLCDTEFDVYRHGRVLLSAHVITLFRVDREWAMKHLIPLFDWSRSRVEARSAWEGFLWSPRLYRPLMEVLRPAFLKAAAHYALLGKHRGQYASLLTYAALDPGDSFTVTEMAGAVRSLPAEGLREVTRSLVKALEGAGEQREEYWRNRIQPFWAKVWPKSLDRAGDTSAASLALLCIAAGDEFPAALIEIAGWLRRVDHPNHVVNQLRESGLCAQHPASALQLLHAVLADQLPWVPRELRMCLDAIGRAMPELREQGRFRRIDELALKAGV